MVRFLAGKVSDKYGRIPVMKVSLVIYVVSLIWIASIHTVWGWLSGAVLYGIAAGMLSPAVSAWAVELGPAHLRGRSVATMYIALEIGIGLGAFFAGWIFQDIIKNVPLVFYLSAIGNLLALVYLLFIYKPGAVIQKEII
ncbi:major facilitator superfamily transporter [compost metagenome]